MIPEALRLQHEAIKASINIIDVVRHYTPLKQEGSNYICKCPFHNENTPSFKVSKAKGIYKCFGCGASGDAIKFVQEKEKLNYMDAMQWLATFVSLPVPIISGSTVEGHHIPLPAVASAKEGRYATSPSPLERAGERSFIPKNIFYKSLSNYQNNNFVQFLYTIFDAGIVDEICENYYIGTSTYYNGGTVFYQVDSESNVRTGKIMPYNPITGKRDREKKPASNWVHSVLAIKDYHLQQCFFGEHLITENLLAPINIVESEKAACLASVWFSDFGIWLAAGGKSYEKYNKERTKINEVTKALRDKWSVLKGRKVILWPDNDGVESWQHLAIELSSIAEFKVITALNNAPGCHPEFIEGPDNTFCQPEQRRTADIADYISSPQARDELIDEFRQALIDYREDEHGLAGQWMIWEQFKKKGLRMIDRVQCCQQLIEDGIFSVDPD